MLSYKKFKSNNRFYICIDNHISEIKICDYLNVSFEEYINTIKLFGATYSNNYGWSFKDENKVLQCVVSLTLMKG